MQMLKEYIQAALKKAEYEVLEDDGSYFGRIPGFQGVWGNAATLEECKIELAEVLEEWLSFRSDRDLELPVVDGIKLTHEKVS